jgi:hypothetical protein
MSGIYQIHVNSGSVQSPSEGRTLISINESGSLFTKDSSGNVTVYGEGGGSPFPFTGSADISGSLNIDFTDTLQFKSNPSLDSVNIDPITQAKLVGEFLGLEETGSISGYTATSYNGIFDGILDINNGFLELPLLANVQTFTVTDGAVGSIVNYQGLQDSSGGGGGISLADQDLILFSGASGSTQFGIIRNHDLDNEESQMNVVSSISYPDVDETNILFNIQFTGPNEDGAEMYIGKRTTSNVIDESVELILNETTTGFEIYNDLSDDTASLFGILDNNDTRIFDVRNDGVFLPNIPTSDPVNAGQLWLDGTTLKVSAGV